MPTQQQLIASAFLCQLLSTLYQPIQVFRYDQRFKTIYIQAGVNDDIALVIDLDGSPRICSMMPNLFQMTNTELKQYISAHRNDKEAFQAAMEVLMSRRNPANRQPYPFELANPEIEVEAILREKLNLIE